VNTVALRPIVLRARIRRDDIQTIDLDVTATNLVTRKNLHLAGGGNSRQLNAPKARNTGVVKDRALFRLRLQSDAANLVVGGKLHAVDAAKDNRGVLVGAAQGLTGRQTHRGRAAEISAYRDFLHT
jgi:hypothetical protein